MPLQHPYDWSEARCLIEDDLSINEVTSRAMRKVTVPVVAVSVMGLYRGGKSYLLNRLAQKGKGNIVVDIPSWVPLFYLFLNRSQIRQRKFKLFIMKLNSLEW